MAALATRTRMSTAFHPQTDGQPEKADSIVERYLRMFATENVRHCYRLLAMAEFSYNCHVHKATGMSPFEADTSENPPNSIRRHGRRVPQTRTEGRCS